MLCLPPHTTHETQPLDCGVFAPLKAHWTTVCHDIFQKNPGKVVTKFNFNFLFSKAWFQALTPANLIAGFKTCGVYPLNRSAISVLPGGSTLLVMMILLMLRLLVLKICLLLIEPMKIVRTCAITNWMAMH